MYFRTTYFCISRYKRARVYQRISPRVYFLISNKGGRAFRKDITFRRSAGHADFFIPRFLLFARTLAPRISLEALLYTKAKG